MTNILYKGPIGKEDISFGSGTFTRRGSLGTVTMTKVPNPRTTIEDYGSSFDTMLTSIGSSTKKTVYVNAAVSVSANTTITSNIHLIVESGSLITVSSGKTLTISGPLEVGDYKVFSLVGTGSVAGLKEVNPIWFGLSASAAGADNLTALTAATAALASGGRFDFTPATYVVAGNWTISTSGNYHWNGATLNFSTNAANQGLLVTSSYVHLWQPNLTGPQYAASNSTQRAIYAYGTDNNPAAPTYINGLTIIGGRITNWGRSAIDMKYVDGFEISGVYAEDLFYLGIQGQSCKNGRVHHNEIADVTGSVSSRSYGIAWTFDQTTGSTATSDPASSDIITDHNIIRSITAWEGLDQHGGVRLSWLNNKVYDSIVGISVASTTTGDGIEYPVSYTKVAGNQFITTIAGATRGLVDAGNSGSFCESNTFSDNTVVGFQDGMYIVNANRGKYRGNTILGASRYGVDLYHDFNLIDFSGNTIGSMVAGAGSGIVLRDVAATISSNNGIIEGNVIDATNADYGINNNITSAHQAVRIKGNSISGYGTSAYRNIGRTNFDIYADNDQESTSGGGEDTIGTFVCRFPATHILKVFAAGTKTGSGADHDHTIKFYYGASNVSFVADNDDGTTADWTFEATIIQTAAAAQKVYWKSTGGATPLDGYEAWTEDTSGTSVTLYIKGIAEGGAGGDVITKEIFTAERKYE